MEVTFTDQLEHFSLILLVVQEFELPPQEIRRFRPENNGHDITHFSLRRHETDIPVSRDVEPSVEARPGGPGK